MAEIFKVSVIQAFNASHEVSVGAQVDFNFTWRSRFKIDPILTPQDTDEFQLRLVFKILTRPDGRSQENQEQSVMNIKKILISKFYTVLDRIVFIAKIERRTVLLAKSLYIQLILWGFSQD